MVAGRQEFGFSARHDDLRCRFDSRFQMIANGTKFGRYDIHSQIGAGGMGEVYLAEDACLERKIALKILPKSVAQDEEMKLAWYPGWYDFGTIYIQNRSTLFDYFQLEIWAKFKFYAGFIEFCAKHKNDNSAFAMQRSGVRPSSTLPFIFKHLPL